MVVVGRRRGKGLLTARASIRCRREIWNPLLRMLPGNMDNHVRLHSAHVLTTRTRPLLLQIGIRGVLYFRMSLSHMLLKAALLDESLATDRTVVLRLPGMLF